MTANQIDKTKDKIRKIRSVLAAERKKFGGYDDSRGLRYLPTALYVKIGDFDGGFRYLNWFNKNFRNDAGFPEFLFEAAIILFKKRKIEDAKKYVLRTYFANTFLIDKFFLKPPSRRNRNVTIGFQYYEYLQNFQYRCDQQELLEFGQWLKDFIESNDFIAFKEEHDTIENQLETEPVGRKRSRLVERLYKLI